VQPKHLRCQPMLVLVFGSVFSCWSQTAQITGRITDPTDRIVPEAAVILTNVDTGIDRRVTSNDQGYFTFPLLNPGHYQMTVRKEGFQTINRPGIVLETGQVARIDFTLQVGAVAESVIVSATVPLLASESATIGQVIGNRKILDLPLNGRDFTQLATLTPGAISRGTNGTTESPILSVNGARVSKTVFMIDGANASSQYYDGAAVVPSVDAIQEFKVQSNSFSAEYGQGTGVVNIMLRSGTNELHGSVFEFLRNEVFDARNFFNSSGVRPPLKQNQFGFTLGGPVVLPHLINGRDKTFFFTDYEGTRLRRPVTNNNPVATAAMRSGDFSGRRTLQDPLLNPRAPFADNRIPASRLSPQAGYFLQFYPEPNTPGGTFVYSPTRENSVDRFDVRMDHRFSETDSLAGSYSLHGSTGLIPGQFAANGAETLSLRRQLANVSEIHGFSPNMFNEFRAAYVRIARLQSPQGLGTNHTVLSGIGGFEDHSRSFPGFPGLTISNYLSFAGNTFRPLNFRDNNYQLMDNLTWIRGKHALKAGILYRAYSSINFNAGLNRGVFTFTGTYTGDPFADFLLGLPFNSQRSFPRDAYGISRISNQNFFIQDDWKVTPRLTLGLGLRYELDHQPVDLHMQAASVDPVSRQVVVLSDSQGNLNLNGQQVTRFLYPLFADVIVPSSKVGLPGSLRRLDQNNFAPRVSVAWRRAEDLVVRAGYGVFYGLVQGNRTQSTAFVNPPFLADELSNLNTTPIPTMTLANIFPSASQGFSLLPLSFFQIDPDVRDPYIQEWNVAVQKVIGKILSLEAAYVGSKGTKLEYSRPLNIPRPGPGVVQNRRPWTRFSSGTYVDNSSYSNYNAFQAKVEIKYWRGLSLLGSYAFAKSIDNLSGDVQGFSSQDPENDRAEKGSSDFDVKQRFVTSANYALPLGAGWTGLAGHLARGWELGGILSLQTGLPFTPSISTDSANTGTSRRPDRIGDGAVERRTLARDFDPTAYRLPAQYSYGNSGRNILYRRGFKNLDLVVLRRFKLGERASLQFRAEFFNFTNTPAFGAPVSNIQSATVGQILSAGEPRDIQFALKLSF
jgi:hypothetical protein